MRSSRTRHLVFREKDPPSVKPNARMDRRAKVRAGGCDGEGEGCPGWPPPHRLSPAHPLVPRELSNVLPAQAKNNLESKSAAKVN